MKQQNWLNKKAVAVAALIGIVVACSSGQPSVDMAKSKNPGGESSEEAANRGLRPEASRKAAPAFKLQDADGKSVTLADYKGKVVLLDFWATWCVPCKIEIPWFAEFETQYKSKGFAVLGVSLDEEGWKLVKPYMEKSKINYRILMGDTKIDQAYGPIEAMPTTFLLDQQGRVAAVHVGLGEREEFESEIKTLLGNANGAVVGASATQLAAN